MSKEEQIMDLIDEAIHWHEEHAVIERIYMEETKPSSEALIAAIIASDLIQEGKQRAYNKHVIRCEIKDVLVNLKQKIERLDS